MTTAATTKAERQSKLLDLAKIVLRARNDADLARKLQTKPPFISKIRHGHLAVGDFLILRLHEAANMPVSEIRDILGQMPFPLQQTLREMRIAANS